MNEEMPEAVQSEDSYFASLPNSESIDIKQLLDIEIEKHDVALRGTSKKGKVYEDGFVAALKHVRENLVGLRVVEVDDIPEVKNSRAAAQAAWSTLKKYETCDPWHPASQPPTPEDFDPTGHIMLRFAHGDGSDPYVSYHACRENQYRNIEAGKQPVTHWRRITPPKP